MVQQPCRSPLCSIHANPFSSEAKPLSASSLLLGFQRSSYQPPAFRFRLNLEETQLVAVAEAELHGPARVTLAQKSPKV